MFICDEEHDDYQEHVRLGHKGERPFFSLSVWRAHRHNRTVELMREFWPDHPGTKRAKLLSGQLNLF